ncbi:heterokaryon incompatibility protein-domain-containing protein [Astrocystis sublimbata]|nr:heterokaryon incompatibility protein-domain-containing protein [Astrocystis sublimbata]
MDVSGSSDNRFYEYEKLEEDGMIRLLELIHDNPPTARISRVKLRDAPRYAALSYTWGENIFDHDLRLGDKIIKITENLSDALTELAPFVIQNKLQLWVDAVCINQKDLDERGSQVGFMDRIYKSSEQVVVWLGKSYGGSDLAMSTISRWCAKITDMRQGDTQWESRNRAIDQVTSGDTDFWGPMDSTPVKAWRAILSLWERPWWRRAWIVQEATALPLTGTILCCGSQKINLEHMRFVLDIRYELVMKNNDNNSFLISTFEQGFADVLDQLNYGIEDGRRSLLSLLKRIRAYDCHDQRDKVFAIVSMASDVPRGAVKPDYTKSLVDVYIDIVRYMMDNAKDGNALQFLGHVIRPTAEWARLDQKDDTGLPSWVPDWRGPKVDIIELRHSLSQDEAIDIPTYNASLGTKPVVKINGCELHVNAVFVDTIATTQPIASNLQPSDTSIQQSWLPTDSHDNYIAGGTIREAYNHTILADIGRQESMTPGNRPYRRGYAMDWSLLDKPLSLVNAKDAELRTFLLDDLVCTTVGRRLFRTAKGYVGLGPAAAKAGDSVCVLMGGRLLYCLRALTGGRHEFVGECYVHGLMDGEVLAGFGECVDTGLEVPVSSFVLV